MNIQITMQQSCSDNKTSRKVEEQKKRKEKCSFSLEFFVAFHDQGSMVIGWQLYIYRPPKIQPCMLSEFLCMAGFSFKEIQRKKGMIVEILLFFCLIILPSLFWFTKKNDQLNHRNNRKFPGDLVSLKVTPRQQPARSCNRYRESCSHNSRRW